MAHGRRARWSRPDPGPDVGGGRERHRADASDRRPDRLHDRESAGAHRQVELGRPGALGLIAGELSTTACAGDVDDNPDRFGQRADPDGGLCPSMPTKPVAWPRIRWSDTPAGPGGRPRSGWAPNRAWTPVSADSRVRVSCTSRMLRPDAYRFVRCSGSSILRVGRTSRCAPLPARSKTTRSNPAGTEAHACHGQRSSIGSRRDAGPPSPESVPRPRRWRR